MTYDRIGSWTTSWGGGFLIALVVLGTAQEAVAQAPPQSVRAVVDQYCVRCHSDRLRTGGLVLENLSLEEMASVDVETWEKVVKKLLGGVMPPPAAPRPAPAAYARLIADLQDVLDEHAAANPNPGRPTLHRLNRAEYTNAIRDLLALEIDGRTLLPGDNSGYGFDNVADVLTMSPGLLERYLLAAKKISRLAVGDPAIRPTTTSYDVPYMTLVQDAHMSDELPFGSKGGVAIRHYFPVDGEYEIQVRLQRNSLNVGGEIRGLDVLNQIDVRLDGVRVALFEWEPRQYSFGGYPAEEDIEDDRLHVRFPASAGIRTVAVTFNHDHWYVEGVGVSRLPPASDAYASGRRTERNFGRIDVGVDQVDITGPFDATVPDDNASRRRLFVCEATGIAAEDETCAATILSAVARRAYRRPVMDGEVDTLLEFYRAGREEEGRFDGGIERGLVRVLTDPNFLFRREHDPESGGGGPHRISDLELASRLSFFLWSSIPDDELLDAAIAGILRRPGMLEQQVHRMLADDRAEAFIENFFGQWLLLRNMATVQPDAKAFPEFDENLREAFEQETRLFLLTQLREDRPLTELLTADYTFVNDRLARHYDLPGIYGSHFRRITLPNNRRAGLLGQGSLLTVTSYAHRTSVVIRGKFVLENILGSPPPPPPPEVPALESTTVEGSLRQRMELHRANPACAACHAQLDPMGFALENFDGIGKWREEDGGVAVDPSGALPDGTTFRGPTDFRAALLNRREAFVTTLAENLLTYALGRGVEAYDMPAVRAVIRDTDAAGNRWSDLVLNVAKSMPFQMRMSES